MLTLYPSNKLEHLSFLLQAVMSNSQQPVLQPKTVLVESTGMQHWLNLQLAEHAGIAMNIVYPMPTRYVWQICRDILGHDKVPMQSTYKREVMLWRIERLLNSEAFTQQNFEAALIDYWHEESDSVSEYKRVNISRLIADTLEQYLMFRPQWLLAWENAESITDNPVALKHEAWQRWIWQALAKEEPHHPVRLQLLALKELENNRDLLPNEVYFFAINTMAPQTLSFFNEIAKYTQIHFFHLNPCVDYWGDAVSDRALAKQLQQGKIDAWVAQQAINPLLRNLGQQGKDLFNLLSQSSHYEISAFDTDYEPDETRPSLLHDIQHDILTGQLLDDGALSAEGSLPTDGSTNTPIQQDHSIVVRSCHSALREVQVLHDYLLQQFSLDDGLSPRDVLVMCPAIENYSPYIEAVFGKSITELNNQNNQRIPCTIADRNPLDADPLVAAFMQLLALPDSRFSVTEFLSFLHLPAVMQKYDIKSAELDLFAYWVQQSNIHWGLDAEHKSTILGVDKANDVFTWRWGLSRLLEGYSHADTDLLIDDNLLALNEIEGQLALTFGKLLHVLEKLAGYGDSLKRPRTMDEWKDYLFDMRDNLFDASAVDQYASQTITKTLGQFFEHYHMSFIRGKNPADVGLITRKWSYQTLRQVLQHAFTSPDSQNQFMTGQVTFCSMMPMRSIPFKIIAVLGLNDGEFPRQSSFVDMDLVNHLGRQIGDRSRRGDDRYLFLEAILSARKALYLSYQGKGIRDNKQREPSLVLSEFLAYLKKYHLFDEVSQQPLHPFSIESFLPIQGKETNAFNLLQQSFDKGWYRLMSSLHSELPSSAELNIDTVSAEQSFSEQFSAERSSAVHVSSEQSSLVQSPSEQSPSEHSPDELPSDAAFAKRVRLTDLIRFFKKPVEFFANNTQSLWLDDIESSLSDVEPFRESGLSMYSMKSDFIDCLLECEKAGYSEEETQHALQQMKTSFMLSGKFPDFPTTETLIDDNSETSQKLVTELSKFVSDDVLSGQLNVPIASNSQVNQVSTDTPISLNSELSAEKTSLSDNIEPSKNTIIDFHVDLSNTGGALDYNLSGNNTRHLVGTWIKHLIVCAHNTPQADEESLSLVAETHSYAICIVKNTQKKEVSIKTEQFNSVSHNKAIEYLATLVEIYQRGALSPLLLAPDLADKLLSGIKLDPDFEPYTADVDTYYQHPEIASRWTTFFDASNFPSQFVVDKYFTHYFPNKIEKDKQTLSDILAIYQPLKTHLASKKSTAKKSATKKSATNKVATIKNSAKQSDTIDIKKARK